MVSVSWCLYSTKDCLVVKEATVRHFFTSVLWVVFSQFNFHIISVGSFKLISLRVLKQELYVLQYHPITIPQIYIFDQHLGKCKYQTLYQQIQRIKRFRSGPGPFLCTY